SYSLEENKKGLSGSIGSSGFSIGYGKSESKLKEKDLTNAKSNLVLGDETTLNKGTDITATNLIHGNISINNGDVRFGARKDVKDIETSSKSSGINLSVKIKSDALDRVKQGVDSFKQMKSGDILGGVATSTNTVTGVVSGLASNQGTKLPISAVNANNTVGKDNLKAAQATNNFYANAGVNLGFNKSSSNSKSHSESGVVTTIRGKDKNSSITYNNVKNIEYVGTQAQNTKFIYNNVENINKTAVELNNYSSSSSRSSGISTGVTIGYGDGTQTSVDAVKVSASKSKMNTNGTNFQNGRFVNVDEVHNNTKNMTLSGFNQEGGTVTGNIQNLTIESKQNTSTTKGSTTGGSLSIAPNGMPSGSASYSQTNGERRVVDNASTFIIGDGSNLKVAKVENTAAAIGTTGSGKLSIDEYVGHDLENVDKLKTVGGSVGVSASGITSLGVNYSDKKQEGITKSTVIGNVEIGKSSGDEINKDLGSMTEITKDRDFKTDIFIESQTINYAKNPEKFKEDLEKAKSEINDIYYAAESTIKPKGKETRSPIEQLGEVKQAKVILNVIGSRLDIAENQDDISKAFEGVSEDLGYKVKVIYTDPGKSPQLIGVDENGNKYIKDGTAYVDKKTGIGYILVNTESPANSTKAGVIGTIAEEQSHVIGKFEGRQKTVPDGSEKGLESLGRPTNDYFKNQYSKNDKAIDLKSDGRDYSNVDFGENVGDKKNEGWDIYKKNIIGKTQPNGSIYTKEQLQETINYRFGKGSHDIDWEKYEVDEEYRTQTNYFYFQAKYFVKIKTIDRSTENFIEITRDNGDKLKLKIVPQKEAILHNFGIKNKNIVLHFKNPNKKYVNKDGYEVVLDNENKPVYDSAIIGTYNFYTYESPLEEIKDWYNHLEDVQLWRKFGTGPNDPTTKEQREKLGGAFSAKILFITYPLIELDSKIKNKKDYSYDEINNFLSEKLREIDYRNNVFMDIKGDNNEN
ncbi:hemagglutinin repeat-containing protein, partial [Fusobacterium polymorphum]|uniref:hemagglutinin repeat-containing protein n=1 Tax=Fusobacterium nucleatum subsp. polymorphum TaxID=76857 RepID=UPI00300AC6ED